MLTYILAMIQKIKKIKNFVEKRRKFQNEKWHGFPEIGQIQLRQIQNP